MKLLLDANLSWRMIAILQQHFDSCFHVDRLQQLDAPAKDTEIWTYAKENGLIIVTNDEDFVDMLMSKAFHQKLFY